MAFHDSRIFSRGVVAEGSAPERDSCDTGGERPELRMCWHTGGDAIHPGWRCGEATGLGGPDRERVILHNGSSDEVLGDGAAGGPVPKPPRKKRVAR